MERDKTLFDFIDKTTEQNGTPINRESMMAIQGFISTNTVKNADGSITQTNSEGHTLKTIKNADGSITQIFVGEKTIAKTIRKLSDGQIEEVVS